MDPKLRTYLERPPPRPAAELRPDVRRLPWLFPLGAAATGGLVLGGIVAEHRDWLLPGGLLWGVLVLAAFVLGRRLSAGTRVLYRTGTFTHAQVVGHEEHTNGEDRWLRVLLAVELEERSGEGLAPKCRRRRYRMSLTDRWLADDGAARFEVGTSLPILVSATRRAAEVFIEDEAIDAAEVKPERAR